MASVVATVTGGDVVVRNLERYAQEAKRRIEKAQAQTAYAIAADWKKNAGKYIYNVPRPPEAYRLTGRFRSSIRPDKVPANLGGKGWVIHDGVEYGARLEFGFMGQDSRGRTYNQAGRPMLREAIAANKDKYLKGVKVAIRFSGR